MTTKPKRAGKLLMGLLILGICSGAILSCNSEYTPKRKGYYRIDLPEHNYQTFDRAGYPYTFEYPVYASVAKDSTFFDSTTENPFWINIDFPQFNARIYVSYKAIGKNNFDKLRDDAFKMTFKHTSKASSIDQTPIQTANGIGGMYFSVGGNAATAHQFFVTDTTRNFLRGALYFDATPNEDSLKPVNDFLQQDMVHLINTFRWRGTAK
jgi:gliding motility-associated lipoprotein GldD